MTKLQNTQIFLMTSIPSLPDSDMIYNIGSLEVEYKPV